MVSYLGRSELLYCLPTDDLLFVYLQPDEVIGNIDDDLVFVMDVGYQAVGGSIWKSVTDEHTMGDD